MITTTQLTTENLHNPQFLAFLAHFDDDFSDNKLVDSTPWCHIKHAHFCATTYHKNGHVMGVRVTSCYPKSEHLNFLYIDKSHRSQGLGQLMMNDWLSESSHSILTIHVKQTLTRTIGFYEQLGFKIIDLSRLPSSLSEWVDRCLVFNPTTYNGVELMAMNRVSNTNF